MKANDPLSGFNLIVESGSWRAGFSDASGLTQEDQARDHASIKMPGLRKLGSVTLKRGLVNSGEDFCKWLSTAKQDKVERCDLIITLLNEGRQPVMVWKVHNAFPAEFDGPVFNAGGNEVTIESLELSHEGIETQQFNPK